MLSVLALAYAAQAQTEAGDLPDTSPDAAGSEVQGLDELYGEAETRSGPARSDPALTTRFRLNGRVLGPETGNRVQFGLMHGTSRNIEPSMSVLIPYDTDVQSSIEDGVGVRRQSGWYFQMQMVDRSRTVEWRRQTPVELIGFDLDLSVTGGCLVPGSPAGALCTFTPGMTVGEDDLDPDTLLPGRFNFDSNFNQRIDPRTHQALKDSEDFLRGDPDLEERVGISLRVPNAGEVLDPSQMSLSSTDRSERVIRRPMLTFSHVDRTLRSNDVGAALAETTRGLVLLEPREWDGYTLAAQIGALFMPGFDANLPSGRGGDPRGDISNNLFLASNNLRMPRESFTMFQTGAGYVAHPDTQPRNADETPAVFYNSFWLGVSPVRTTDQTVTSRFHTTGDREIVQSRYRQGGTGSPLEGIRGRITFIDNVANDLELLELDNIDDLFIQVGLGISRQDAIREQITRQRSTFQYVPHLSFTGNRTDGRSVLRYYAGVINPRDANFYLGADATYQASNNVRVSASVIGYTRPDPDYYSNAEVSIARDFVVEERGVLTLGVSGAIEFDRPNLIAESPGRQDQNDRVDLFGQYRGDWGRVTGRLRASGLRNGNRKHSATFGASVPVAERAQMSVQATPVSNEDAYIQAQVGLAVPIADQANSPVLQAQYARVRYNFGNDAFGQEQRTTEDTFRASLQFEF